MTILLIPVLLLALTEQEQLHQKRNFATRVVEADQGGLTIDFELADLTMVPVRYQGAEYFTVELEGGGWLEEPGAPDLPLASRLVAMPDLSDIQVELVDAEYTTQQNIDIFPVQAGDFWENPEPGYFQRDTEIWQRDAFYPEQLLQTGDPAIMRDYRVARLTFQPVQYNPVTRELRVYHSLRVRVEFNGTNPINQKTTHHAHPSSAMRGVYQDMILNIDQMENSDPAMRDIFDEPSFPGTYIIVYPNVAESYLEPLVEWKRRKGHIVDMANTADIGTSYAAIKGYVQDAYDEWENPPDYLLLIGDNSGSYSVAASDSYGDHQYSRLEGGDILADIVVGRFSVESATTLQTVVAKSVKYESDPYMTETDWWTHATVIAGSSYSGLSSIQTNQQVKWRLQNVGYTLVDTCWYNAGCNTPTMITQTMNEGISILNYRGWIGMEGWSNSMANNLNNGWMTPLVVIPTCNTGTWMSGTSFTEGFLRAGTPTLGRGGVASVGLATSATHTRYNNTLCMGLYGGMLDWGLKSFGAAIFRGKYELYLSFPNNASNVSDFCSWFNEMGDPGLEVRYGVQDELIADYPTQVASGSSFLPVDVSRNSAPLEGALVTLFREGEIFERRHTDTAGNALVPLPYDCDPGDLMVTVSFFNTLPVLGDCEVIDSDTYLSVTGFEIDDSAGDNAGDVNPGETIAFELNLLNSGNSTTLTGITLTAEVDAVWGDLTVDSQTADDLSPGATGSTDGDFVIELTGDIEDAALVPIQIAIASDQGDFDALVELPVSAPVLEMAGIQLLSGSLEPGQTATFAVELINTGSKTLTGASGMLLLNDPLITAVDSLGTWSAIAPGGSGSNTLDPFTIEIDALTVVGYPIITGLEWTSTTDIEGALIVEGMIGNPGQDDPTGPDNYGYWAIEDQDLNYVTTPVYDWIEISGTAGGDGTACDLSDTGVEGDDSINVPLPFTFIYYGMEHDSVTICSNGYIALGYNTTWFNNGRNQPLPNPQGARNMIAPMWDDLHFSGSGDAWYYYDNELHVFIVEWYEAKNWNNNNNTFQVILQDPAHYPSATGDGGITFQYNEFHDSAGGVPGWDNPYCTIGIENNNATDGLTLSYWDNQPNTMHPVSDGDAIFFTPNPSGLAGTPHLDLTQLEFDIYMTPDSTLLTDLVIGNSGDAALSYLISVENLDGRAYGSDEYGYTWMDSDEGAGPVYNWIDITGYGQDITFPDHDASTLPLDLGFEMSLYGERFSQMRINANGFISFSDSCAGNYCWYNQPLPDPDMPLNMIAGYWDDMRPEDDQAGYCYFYTNDLDSAIVSFVNVPHTNGALQQGPFTFQMILRANGEITMQYDSMGNCTYGTVGIQNHDGQLGFNLVYNDSYIHDDMAIRFTAPFWLTIENVSGIVPAWSERSIEVSIDPAGASLQYGTYHGMIRLETNDQQNELVEIPVTLHCWPEAVDPVTGPESFCLKQNYPNPFNPTTSIEFVLPQTGAVELTIYDLAGRRVALLVDEALPAGEHQVTFDGEELASGLYFYELTAGQQRAVRKMVLVK